MSNSYISRYGPATAVFILDGTNIKNWGKTDQPLVIATMRPLRDLEIHHGGGGIIVDNLTSGAQVTISLQPNTPDSATCSALYASGKIIEAEWTNVGTGEVWSLSAGVACDLGEHARVVSPSDDVYSFKFLNVIPKNGNA